MSGRKHDANDAIDSKWYPVDRGRDRSALRKNAHELELRWPGCYETRITDGYDTGEFMLTVKHRD